MRACTVGFELAEELQHARVLAVEFVEQAGETLGLQSQRPDPFRAGGSHARVLGNGVSGGIHVSIGGIHQTAEREFRWAF